MPAIKSLDDLKRLREEAQRVRELKVNEGKTEIVISMGTVGIAAGARDTLKAILNFIETKNLQSIIVKQTGNLGVEGQDPLVQITLPGAEKIMYGKVHPSFVDRLMQEHVCDGKPIADRIYKA
ncbi:MAG: (2Fe-2S) ferredoxin domain-containing protein [Anaerolineaceae bacterium]